MITRKFREIHFFFDRFFNNLSGKVWKRIIS